MKKIQALILVLALFTLAFSGAASAAAQKSIRVWVGDQEVKFDIPPVVANNTTYVEFKGLFTALKYTIAYEAVTKTVTGQSGSSSIKINLTTGQAVVNGKAAAQTVQPLALNGRTLIPLRFVGEATGKLVEWNPSEQSIKIKEKGPTAADQQEIQALLTQQDAYDMAGDREGFLSTIDPASPLYTYFKNISPEEYNKVIVHTTTKLVQIIEWQPNTATILVHQLSEKVSGGFYLNNEDDAQMTLVRGSDGKWDLSDLELLSLNYIDTEEILNQVADVPAADKEKIIAVLNKQLEASNNEDLAAYKETIDPATPHLDELLAPTQQIFDQYDLKFSFEDVSIINYTGTEAQVYLTQATEKIKGPQFQNSRVRLVVTLIKTAAGEWITTLDTKIISVEALQDPNSKF
ncbi:copper amine oxidase N-terminal domain-containing protein [Paenibacillus solisilvae]|uniref:Copper amine oxidase N-terminal domain-containing protein n=1 Tax=Paenibacillus solisilvae TaxID=2486751 RepID=A0ABW0W557_9BACL